MKMHLMWMLCYLLVAMVIGFTRGDDGCGTLVLTSTKGNITFPDNVGVNCTWYIVANETATQVMVHFDKLELLEGTATLTVVAGNDTNSRVIANVTKHSGPLTVISPTNITKVMLTQGPKSNVQSFATYDMKECQLSITGMMGVVKSPTYLNGTGNITCTYNVSMPTNEDVVLLSFHNFTLTMGQLYVVFDLSNKTHYLNGNTTPDDLFGAAGTLSFSMELTLKNDTSQQQFQAVYQTVHKGCSGTFTSIDNYTSLSLPTTNLLPIVCYAQFVTKDDKKQVHMINPGKSSLVNGADSIVYLDGGSQTAPVIASSMDDILWYVSSGKKMTVVANLGTKNSRTYIFSHRQDEFSKFYQLTDTITTVSLNGVAVNNNTVFIQFLSSTNKKVKIELQSTGTNLSRDASVVIQDQHALPLFTFGNDTVLFPITTPGNRALVFVKNLNGDQTVNLKATAVESDCNQLYTGDTGAVMFVAPVTTTQCTLAVSTAKSTILDLTSVNLCKTGKLEIYEGFSLTQKKLATLFGNSTYKTLPQIRFPAGAGPRIVWTDPSNTCVGPTLTARYWTDDSAMSCGTLGNATSGGISSPNFPNRYPLNTNCTWAIPAQNNSLLYLSLNSLDLASGHSLTLQQSNGTATTTLSTFSGTNLTNDMIVTNVNLSLTFCSISEGKEQQLEQPGQGVDVAYKIMSCGGLVTNTSTNITSPKAGDKSIECIWMIQVPADGKANGSVNIVNATITLNGYKKTSSGMLELYDGGSLRGHMWSSVNMTKNNVTFLSRTNAMLVRYSYTPSAADSIQLTAADTFTFNLTFATFTCNSSDVCDNGTCIHPDWYCNGIYECRDGYDERKCKIVPPPAPTPQPHVEPSKAGVAGFWVAICLFLGILIGLVAAVFVPRIVRRIKQRNYQPNSNYGTLTEDT